MAQHVKILGVLHIVLGCLGLLGALIVFFVLGGVSGFLRNAPDIDSDTRMAAPILAMISVFVPILIAALSAPGIVVGIGLTQFRPWARVWGIVMSALDLLSIPIGTILGVYGLWVLLKPETEALFRAPAPYYPAYPPPAQPPAGPGAMPRR